MSILTGEVIGVFTHIERAYEDRAGAFKPRDERCVLASRSAVAIDFGACTSGQARNVEQVLDRKGYAGERTKRLAVNPRRVDRIRPSERARRRHVGEGAERGVPRLDARQRGFGHFARADSSSCNRRGDRPGRAFQDATAHGANTGAGS